MFMWNRNKAVLSKFLNYLDVAQEAIDCFAEGLRHHIEHGPDTHFARFVDETHQRESDADTLRHEIEIELFKKSLLPESREDLLLMLERVDLIPNQAEEALRMMLIQRVVLPDFVKEGLVELADLGVEGFRLVAEAVREALGPGASIGDLNRRIDETESVGDRVEQRLLSSIFDSDLSLAEKMLCRDTVTEVGCLCDLEEDVGFFLTVFVVKRHV